MPDQKPPRLESNERDTLHALLQYQRESLVRKVTGVDDTAARRSPVRSGTTLLWLMKHMAGAEIVWIVERFAGEGTAPRSDEVQPGDTLAAAVENYRTRGRGSTRSWPRRPISKCRAAMSATKRRSISAGC